MKRPITPLSIAAALALTAFGWAGGGAAAPPVAGAAAACANAGKTAREIAPRAAEKAIRCLINKKRRASGGAQLRNNSALRRAARKHSRYSERMNCIAHQCPGEASFATRLAREGYRARWAGETIGSRRGGGSSARGIVRAWMASSAHRAVLLSGRGREIGVGVVWGSPRAGIFTADLGRRSR